MRVGGGCFHYQVVILRRHQIINTEARSFCTANLTANDQSTGRIDGHAAVTLSCHMLTCSSGSNIYAGCDSFRTAGDNYRPQNTYARLKVRYLTATPVSVCIPQVVSCLVSKVVSTVVHVLHVGLQQVLDGVLDNQFSFVGKCCHCLVLNTENHHTGCRLFLTFYATLQGLFGDCSDTKHMIEFRLIETLQCRQILIVLRGIMVRSHSRIYHDYMPVLVAQSIRCSTHVIAGCRIQTFENIMVFTFQLQLYLSRVRRSRRSIIDMPSTVFEFTYICLHCQ